MIQSLAPVAADMLRALVAGDQAALGRVKDRIPDPLKSEALLLSEESRLRELEARKRG